MPCKSAHGGHAGTMNPLLCFAVKVNPQHPKLAAGNIVVGNSQGDKDLKEPGKQLDKKQEFLPFHSNQGATDLIAPPLCDCRSQGR